MNIVIERPFRVNLAELREQIEWERRMKDEYRDLGLPAVCGAAASTWAFTNSGRTSLLDGTFDIDTDVWKCGLLLSNSDIGAASSVYSSVTNECGTAGSGYTAGGTTIVLTLAGAGTVTTDIQTDPVWTAGTANLACKYAAIYESGGKILCYSDLDTTSSTTSVTTTSGNTFTVAAHASGVMTLT